MRRVLCCVESNAAARALLAGSAGGEGVAAALAERQRCWCAVLEEYWPRDDNRSALARHRDRLRSYAQPRPGLERRPALGTVCEALDEACLLVLPRLLPSAAFFELRETARERIERVLV